MPDDGFSRAVAHKASTDQSKILAAVQRPISIHCIQVMVPAPGWKTTRPGFCLSRVDHSPMYTATGLVVDVILEAAQERLPR